MTGTGDQLKQVQETEVGMDQSHLKLRFRKSSHLGLSDKGKLWAASLMLTGQLPVGGGQRLVNGNGWRREVQAGL